MAPYHTSHGWFRVELDQLLSVWLDCMDLEESLSDREPEKRKPAPQDTKTEHTTSHDENDGLPEDLRYCLASEAPTATTIRTNLTRRLGKESANEMLAMLVSKNC